jgi:hypothetical protein
MNTPTAGSTVAKDLKDANGTTAGDTNNSRVVKTGGDISSRRDVNNSRDSREVESRRADSSIKDNWNHGRDASNSSDVNISRNAINRRDARIVENTSSGKDDNSMV